MLYLRVCEREACWVLLTHLWEAREACWVLLILLPCVGGEACWVCVTPAPMGEGGMLGVCNSCSRGVRSEG